MSSVKFPDMQQVEKTAAEWVVKIDRGLTPDEKPLLSQWLEESPAHGEALVKLASMWDLLDVLSPIAKLMPIDSLKLDDRVLNERSFRRSNESINNANDSSAAKRVFSATFAIAATVLISIGLLLFFIPNNNEQGASMIATNVVVQPEAMLYKTSIGETSRATLIDGSHLHLNADSEVWVRFTESARELELVNGEVFFEVAKDANKPFVVNVGADQVTAVGTAFNINTQDGIKTNVLVTEGKVRINSNFLTPEMVYQEVFLTPGQSVTLTDNKPELKTDQDVDALLSWREGVIVFQGEPLSQVISKIDRYTSLEFKIMDERAANILVGGLFKAGDTEQLLLVLENNFGVKSTIIGNEVLLHKSAD